MKKKTLKTVIAVSATALLMTGCSTAEDASVGQQFASHDYEDAPIWNTLEFDTTLWPSGEGDMNTVSPVVSMSSESLYMVSEDNTCNLSAVIDYTESYQANREERLNSMNYLYDRAGDSTTEIDEVTVQDINGVDYAVAEYNSHDFITVIDENPDYEGPELQPVYKKTAVRAFDKLAPIPGLEDMVGEGMFGSDPKEGLPVAVITVICETEEQLTDEMWENGVERLIIDFTGESAGDQMFEGEPDIIFDEEHLGDGENVEEEVGDIVPAEPEPQTEGSEEPAPQEESDDPGNNSSDSSIIE